MTGLTNLLLASDVEFDRALGGLLEALYGAIVAGVFSAGGSYRFLILGGGARGGPIVRVDCAKFCC